MIFGIGCDIVNVSRFRHWIGKPAMIERFFNEKEMLESDRASEQKFAEHYAVRFAAKEAFGKALGTGLEGWQLKDVYIQKDEKGKPSLFVEGSALNVLEERTGEKYNTERLKIHVSLSHEKEYALAYAVIEGR